MDFNSERAATFINHSDSSIFILNMSMGISSPIDESFSYAIQGELEPRKTKVFPHAMYSGQLMTIPRMASTWEQHFNTARGIYKSCALLMYATPGSVELKQFVDHYLSQGASLPLTDAIARVDYTINGDVRQQTFPLKAVLLQLQGGQCP